MNLKLKRTPGIYLVGFMASGKSTVGRHLAHRLGWNFFDTDSEIEAAERVTVAELFASRGEPEFRRIETEIIRQHVRWIERGRPAVIALGGGAFVSPVNRELLENNGIAIWLDCPFEKVSQRVAAAGHGDGAAAGRRCRTVRQLCTRRAAMHTAWPMSASPSRRTTPNEWSM